VSALVALGAALTLAGQDGERQAAAAPENFEDVATETCSRTYLSGFDTMTYAEHAYPGVPRRALASVKAVGHVASSQGSPPDYEFVLANSVFVKDGTVAVVCGNMAAASFDSVTFLRPGPPALDRTLGRAP
jgi:hypothetical protein